MLTKAAATESEVHTLLRTWSPNPSPQFTMTTAVVAREGGSSVIQATMVPGTISHASTLQVLVDGEPYDGPARGVALTVTPSRVELRCPSGLDVFMARRSLLLTVDLHVPETTETTGLLRNKNGLWNDDFRASMPWRTTTLELRMSTPATIVYPCRAYLGSSWGIAATSCSSIPPRINPPQSRYPRRYSFDPLRSLFLPHRPCLKPLTPRNRPPVERLSSSPRLRALHSLKARTPARPTGA